MAKQLIKNAFQFYLIILFVFLVTSCNQDNRFLTDSSGKKYETGKVYHQEKSGADSVDFALYIPGQAVQQKNIPVIFFLDPHANGAQPVEKYKTSAEEYGYMLVGSNNIKNGLAASYARNNFEHLVSHLDKKFNIDKNQLYVAGFSGGAKLALLFADRLGSISGAIACGGSIPFTTDFEPSFYYVGITGNQDFNYLETKQSFNAYDRNGYDYTSVVFDGGHEWAPVSAFNQGLNGLKIYAMKLEHLPEDKKWLQQLYTQMMDSAKVAREKNDMIQEYHVYQQMNRWFHGLKPTVEVRKSMLALQNNPAFVNQMQKQQSLLRKEIKLRAEYIRAIEKRDIDWWETEVENFIKTAKSENEQAALVSQRLLNYISMASYMLIKTDLNDGRLDEALKKIKIYEMVDNNNPDVYLMYARYNLMLDDTAKMVEYYKKALNMGLKNTDEYINDPSWKALFNHPEILHMS